MFQLIGNNQRIDFKQLTVLIILFITLTPQRGHRRSTGLLVDCQLISDLTKSSKLFADLSTGGSIFRHILSYVESGRNFLSTASLSDNNSDQQSTTNSTLSELLLPSSSSSDFDITTTSSISSSSSTTTAPITTTPSIITEASTVISDQLNNNQREHGSKSISESPIINSLRANLMDSLKQKANLQSASPSTSSSTSTLSSFNLKHIKRDPLKEELQLRLEYIKMKILHKLGLNKAPSIRTKMDHEAYTQLLELRQLHSDPNKAHAATRTDYYGMDQGNVGEEESDKLFLLPVKSGFSSATFNLTLDIDTSRYPFRKVTLFTKMSNILASYDNEIGVTLLRRVGGGIGQTTWSWVNNTSYESYLGRMKPINNGVSNPLRYSDNTLNDEYEWREYDLTKLLMKNKWKPLENQPMIVIETDPSRLHSSLMTIEFDYMSASRRRRRVDCNSTKNTSSCCRESFYVNFTQIGWDNWIVQPPGYYANYCKGKCDISHARYHHTTVVQKYSSIINLCCSPREMSNISLIYVNESGYLFQKNLANMVVESCDCA